MKQKKIYVCSFVKLCTDLDNRTIGYVLTCRKCFITADKDAVYKAVKRIQKESMELLTSEVVVYRTKVEDDTCTKEHLQDTIESANKELKRYLNRKIHTLIDKTLDNLYAGKKL